MKTGNFTFGWVRNRARRRPGASQVVTSIQHKDVGRYLSNQRNRNGMKTKYTSYQTLSRDRIMKIY